VINYKLQRDFIGLQGGAVMKQRKVLVFLTLILAIVLIWNVPLYAKSKKIVWRAQSSYPAGLPQLYAPAERFAEKIEKLTDGQLVVKMSPGGSIVPSKKIFDAVSAGTLDLG